MLQVGTIRVLMVLMGVNSPDQPQLGPLPTHLVHGLGALYKLRPGQAHAPWLSLGVLV